MKTIIIGGVAAGMSAAAKLRRLDQDMDIVVYEKGGDLSYSGCGMPYFLSDVVPEERRLIARYKKDFEQKNIRVHLHHEVTSVNPQAQTITMTNLLDKTTGSDSYDRLLIATGTTAIRTNVPGSEDITVHALNQLDDARILKPALQHASTVAIIGGGYIGIEVADNLLEMGIKVHVIEQQKQILPVFDKAIADKAQARLTTAGVMVHTNERLSSYEATTDGILVHTNQDSYEVDLVIEAIGVRPNTDFLADTGINRLDNGAIVINDHCETSLTNVYAAGDCVAYHHRIKDAPAFVPLGTHANKAGRVVAEHIAGNPMSFAGIVGSNIVKVVDLGIAKTGLGMEEAKRLGLPCDYVDITAKHQTGYYPGASDLFVRIVYDTTNGRLKGAQLVGEKGVSGRINIMALAITKELTAAEFAQLDFAYSPPFTPVWDPLLVAANQIKV